MLDKMIDEEPVNTGREVVLHRRCELVRLAKAITLLRRLSAHCSVIVVAAMCVFGVHCVHAENLSSEEQSTRNLVDLSASATRVVANEEIRVTLAAEHRGPEPAELARLANEDIAWATELINDKQSVKINAGTYQTSPMYSNGDQSRPTWQLVQEIVVVSLSIDEVAELLGQLQSRLQIRNTQFSMTPNTRREVENELIEEAMQAFRQRASVIGRAMPTSDYEIVHIVVRTGSEMGPQFRMRGGVAMARTQEASAVPAPTMDAGQTHVTVHVSGSVVFP